MDYLSFQYTVNTRSRQLSHKNEALRKIAQVCKTWHSAAVVPLYRNLQISRPESIPLLLRTLKTSKYLQNMIQDLSYIPPKSSKLKWVGKPVKDQHDKLCQICAILPNAVTLHLKLVVQASVPLLTGNANNIRSLHMVTVGGILSSHDMTNLSFPVLETLTLEILPLVSRLYTILAGCPSISDLPSAEFIHIADRLRSFMAAMGCDES